MKKNTQINPVGLKGYEINERMKELMGIKPINENKSNIVVELTKMGPDGNAYAVVRENHEWYIKKTSKTSNLLAEDFKYIGGLQNKKQEAYPSYAKAIKHLNLKFKSLAEAYNYTGEINLFENDNLISEMGVAGFSEMKSGGFTGHGNMEGNKPMEEGWMEEDDMNMSEEVEMTEAEKAIDDMLKEYNKNTSDDLENNNADSDYERAFEYMNDEDFPDLTGDGKVSKVEMTEAEKAIDDMLKEYNKNTSDDLENNNADSDYERAFEYMNDEDFPDLTGDGKVSKADILKGRGVELDEELKDNQGKLDMNKNGKLDSDDFKKLRATESVDEEFTEEVVNETLKRLSSLLNSDLKKKV